RERGDDVPGAHQVEALDEGADQVLVLAVVPAQPGSERIGDRLTQRLGQLGQLRLRRARTKALVVAPPVPLEPGLQPVEQTGQPGRTTLWWRIGGLRGGAGTDGPAADRFND